MSPEGSRSVILLSLGRHAESQRCLERFPNRIALPTRSRRSHYNRIEQVFGPRFYRYSAQRVGPVSGNRDSSGGVLGEDLDLRSGAGRVPVKCPDRQAVRQVVSVGTSNNRWASKIYIDKSGANSTILENFGFASWPIFHDWGFFQWFL